MHQQLCHPNIVSFKELRLTPTHLAIVMEYAAGGELFDRISKAGRLNENEARFYFQQLISGVAYMQSMGVSHRDLKARRTAAVTARGPHAHAGFPGLTRTPPPQLENVLLDASSGGAPIIKICDFGYSKSSHLHSQPKSTVGTPAYIAPEILTRQKTYDGNQSDVWSCGVTLFVLLCGCYPFEDPANPRDFRKTMQRILAASYALPQGVALSAECQDLLRSMFELSPEKRISIPQIFSHTFYRKNLPLELGA